MYITLYAKKMRQFKCSEEGRDFFIHITDKILLHIKQANLSAQTHMPSSVSDSVFSTHFLTYLCYIFYIVIFVTLVIYITV